MLKKCLLWLFVWLVWFISFSNAVNYVVNSSWTDYLPQYIYYTPNISVENYLCSTNKCYISLDFWLKDYPTTDYQCMTNANNVFSCSCVWNRPCSTYSWVVKLTYSSSFNVFQYITFNDWQSCPECETCPEINTGDILSWSCDINYCVENDLCPTSTWSRSELVINDIVHEWKPLINVSIPDDIYWDYSTDDNQFDLYVWSWYNQEYIDSILAINSYRPDNDDFTNIFVSWLTLIFPYIFVALLIVFMWKLLKRIFK